MTTTYISVDIETTGHVPGLSSMISLGAAVFNEGGVVVGQFQVNLDELEGEPRDIDTMKWWESWPKSWKKSRLGPIEPEMAMRSFHHLVFNTENPVLIAWPVAFDLMFVRWYSYKFTGKDLHFVHSLDIRSYAAGKLNTSPVGLSDKLRALGIYEGTEADGNSHVAFNDALAQGNLFFSIKGLL